MDENREMVAIKALHQFLSDFSLTDSNKNIMLSAQRFMHGAENWPFTTKLYTLIIIEEHNLIVSVLLGNISHNLAVTGCSNNRELHFSTTLPLNSSIVADVSELIPSWLKTVFTVSSTILQSPVNVI